MTSSAILMYPKGVIRTKAMALFTPRNQLRNMQQAAAARALINPDEAHHNLVQSIAAGLLLGSPVTVVPDESPLFEDDCLF